MKPYAGKAEDESSPRWPILLFYAGTFLFWAGLYVYVPTLAPYTEFLGGSLSLIGLVVGAYGLTQALFRIPVGVWSDRKGRRKPVMLVGLLLVSLSGLGLALSPNVWCLILSRGMAGLAASSWVVMSVFFASYFPDRQATRAMGLISFCTGVSQMVSIYSGGWIAEAYGWIPPFYVGAGLGAVGACFMAALPERSSQRPRTASLGQILTVGRAPLLLVLSAIAALRQYATFATMYGFIPLYAVRLEASKEQLGLLTLVGVVSRTIATLLSGSFVAERVGYGRTVGVGLLLSAASIGGIPLIHTFTKLCLAQALNGIGAGLAWPVMMGLVIRTVPPEDRATAMGFFQAIYAIGMFGGPAMAGIVGDWLGLAGVFLSTGLVCGIAGLLAFLKIPAE